MCWRAGVVIGGVSKMIPYGVCISSIARKTRKIITVT